MSEESKTTPGDEETEGIAIRLQWGQSEQAPTIYANHLYITHSGNEFYLVFGELNPILEVDVDNPPDHLEIKPTVKIAVATENMIKFAKAIQDNVDRFRDKLG